MNTALLLAAALLGQPAAPSASVGIEQNGIVFEELALGEANAAIARLGTRGDDPDALINLGTAYARKGMKRQALDCYRAAIASETGYDLQLADGRWVDSRQAARLAAKALAANGALALR